MTEARRRVIEDFLSQKRLAVVGVSRDQRDFSRAVFREFDQRGYDLVPVNPNASELEGRRCFARVSEVDPPVEGALLLNSADLTEQVVEDCAAAGVRRVWMHRATGRGAVDAKAIEFCRANGIEVVDGECPMMFLSHTSWFHRFHGFFRKLRD